MFQRLKKKIIDKFYNALKQEIKQQLFEEFDSNEGNLILEELLKREDKRTIRIMLFRFLFPLDFKDVPDERKRFEIYKEIGDRESIINLFKGRYTRAYEAFFVAKGDEIEQSRGRVLEDANIIDMAQGASKVLENWEKREEINKKRSKISNYLTNKQ